MQLSPGLRKLQQSWTFHILTAGIIAGGVTAFTCWGTANDFTVGCLRSGLIAAGIYIFAAFQHSPGSASFHPDGTENQAVKEFQTQGK